MNIKYMIINNHTHINPTGMVPLCLICGNINVHYIFGNQAVLVHVCDIKNCLSFVPTEV